MTVCTHPVDDFMPCRFCEPRKWEAMQEAAIAAPREQRPSRAGEDEMMTAATPSETARHDLVRVMAARLHEESDHGKDGCAMGWLPICNCTEKATVAASVLVQFDASCESDGVGGHWHVNPEYLDE